jgi:hypothetical protein
LHYRFGYYRQCITLHVHMWSLKYLYVTRILRVRKSTHARDIRIILHLCNTRRVESLPGKLYVFWCTLAYTVHAVDTYMLRYTVRNNSTTTFPELKFVLPYIHPSKKHSMLLPDVSHLRITVIVPARTREYHCHTLYVTCVHSKSYL